MRKFVAVMNIPSPYRLHLLGELARQLKERGVAFPCRSDLHEFNASKPILLVRY